MRKVKVRKLQGQTEFVRGRPLCLLCGAQMVPRHRHEGGIWVDDGWECERTFDPKASGCGARLSKVQVAGLMRETMYRRALVHLGILLPDEADLPVDDKPRDFRLVPSPAAP